MDDQDKKSFEELTDEELEDAVGGRHGSLASSYDNMRARLKKFLDNGGTL